MKKAKTKMKSQRFKCSNPECEMVFANPIIVQDLSLKNGSSYSACPYCLTEIVVEKNSEVEEKKRTSKKKRAKIEETITQPTILKPAEKSLVKENKCPYHFGYLSQRSRKEQIPEECITCEKIVQCMLKKVTG
jgi:hypothetical protein